MTTRSNGGVFRRLAAAGAVVATMLASLPSSAAIPPGTSSLAQATAKISGINPSDRAGSSFASGDVNGDGIGDLVVGASGADPVRSDEGAIYVFYGPVTGNETLADADAVRTGLVPMDLAGQHVSVGDLTGDGIDDIAVGAPGADTGGDRAGVVYVVHGPVMGTASLGSADAILIGAAPGDTAGATAIGDLDGDGIDDLIVGAPRSNANGYESGAVFVVYGPVAGTMNLASADAIRLGTAPEDSVGFMSIATGDLDGDGRDDLIVGMPGADSAQINAGAAFVVRGPVIGVATLASADAALYGEVAHDNAGWSVAAGDLNGDGTDDLIVGAPFYDGMAWGSGAAYVVNGPVAGTASLASADAKRIGDGELFRAGRPVAAGDFNDDGYDDLIVIADGHDEAGDESGAAYVEFGPVSGTAHLSASDATLVGEAAYDSVSVAATGDVNGDGTDDLLVGAPAHSQPASWAGAAYVFTGESCGDATTLGLVDRLDETLPPPLGGSDGVIRPLGCHISRR